MSIPEGGNSDAKAQTPAQVGQDEPPGCCMMHGGQQEIRGRGRVLASLVLALGLVLSEMDLLRTEGAGQAAMGAP